MLKTNLIIDGHVLFYDCYDLDKFFCAAIKNLDNMYTSTYPEDNDYQKVLLFTEGKDNDYFSRMKFRLQTSKHDMLLHEVFGLFQDYVLSIKDQMNTLLHDLALDGVIFLSFRACLALPSHLMCHQSQLRQYISKVLLVYFL